MAVAGLGFLLLFIGLFGTFFGFDDGSEGDEDSSDTQDDMDPTTQQPPGPVFPPDPAPVQPPGPVFPPDPAPVQPPAVGDPTVFDDTDGSDDGSVAATARGQVLSGGLTADGPGAENIDATTPNDSFFDVGFTDLTFLGGSGSDTFFPGLGTNTLIGGAGADTAFANPPGTNTFFGEGGSDRFFATSGTNTAHGGAGPDTLGVAGGTNILNGDGGDDRIQIRNLGGPDTANGGAGDDVIAVQNTLTTQNTVVTGGSGNDFFGVNDTRAEGGAPVGTYTVTDFGNDGGGSGDGDPTNNDYVDLWRRYGSLQDAKDDLDADGDFDQADGLELTGVTSADLTEDNTGLSDTPGTLIPRAIIGFEGAGPNVYLVPNPIVNGGATTYIGWGDGTQSTDNQRTFDLYQHTYASDGFYVVTVEMHSTANPGQIETAEYVVNTAARTVTFAGAEGAEAPVPGNPNVFDDTDGTDDGRATATADGDIVSGGLTADGNGAENTDTTTPNDLILAGGFSNTMLVGGVGDDQIEPGGGGNLVLGGAGNDVLFDGVGNDSFYGGPGSDIIAPARGVNVAHGGDGDDALTVGFAGSGTNSAFGEAGDDNFLISAGSGTNTAVGGSGDDIFALQANGTGTTTVTGGMGSDAFLLSRFPSEGSGLTPPPVTITDFGNDSGATVDSNTTNNDYINLWQYYDTLFDARVDFGTDSDFDRLDGVSLPGVVFTNLNSDTTGLSDIPGHLVAQADVTFNGPGPSVAVVPKPIVNGGATSTIDWGDSSGIQTLGTEVTYTHSYTTQGTYTVTVEFQSIANAPQTASVQFSVDTVNRTVTAVP